MSLLRSSLLFLALLAPPAAGATTLIHLDDAGLIDGSGLIVIGTCDATRTEWIDGLLVTVASVRIESTLKGEPAGRVEVLIPGGIDTDRAIPVAVVVPGAPSVTPGERLLLFLAPVPPDGGENRLATKSADGPRFAVTGLSQGKLSIVENAAGERVVVRDLAGVGLLDHGRLRPGDRRAEPLAAFEERIARRLAAAGEGGRR